MPSLSARLRPSRSLGDFEGPLLMLDLTLLITVHAPFDVVFPSSSSGSSRRFSCSYSVAAERLVLSLMCPDMDTYCVQAVRTSKRQRNWAPFQTAVGHWSAHGPFILNVSLSHDVFALLPSPAWLNCNRLLAQEFLFTHALSIC